MKPTLATNRPLALSLNIKKLFFYSLCWPIACLGTFHLFSITFITFPLIINSRRRATRQFLAPDIFQKPFSRDIIYYCPECGLPCNSALFTAHILDAHKDTRIVNSV